MSAEKRRILLVEDDVDLMEQTRDFLSGEGYEMLCAGTEKEGTALIEKENFDAAVLDLMLENPDSGFVMAYQIKKKSAAIPVLLVTSVTRDTGYAFGSAGGKDGWIKADVIIQKDMRFEQLKSELERLLGAVK